MGNITKRLLSLLLVLTMVVSMGALQVFAAKGDVASYNDVAYGSLEEALAAAEGAFKDSGIKQVVILENDLTAQSITVPNGVALDCNSKVVTVNDLAVFGSIVNTGNGGRLHISGNCSITDGASAMPVYLPDEDCYILSSYTAESLGVREKGAAVVFGYAPKFQDAEAYNRIANGGKVRVSFSLEWTGCEEALVFDCSDELMAKYAQMALTYANLPVKVALQLYVTNMEVLGSGKDVYITPILKNEMGAIAYGEPMHYETSGVKVDIAQAENGTVTTDTNYYAVGDTVTLTATPNVGFGLKRLLVESNGQIVDIGKVSYAGGAYSFVAAREDYTVAAEFAPPVFTAVQGNWDLNDQFNGSLTITQQKEGTTVMTTASNYQAVSVKVKDFTPSRNENGSLKKGNFAAQVYFIFDNGKQFQVRIHNTDADGNYKIQTMGDTNSFTRWKWRADLTAAQKANLLDGDGVVFTVKIVGSNAEMYVDGKLMATVALEENGVSYDGSLAQVKICLNGNTGVKNMQIPFTLESAKSTTAVIRLPALENGTVTADKTKCPFGETVTLTVTPNSGYSQKLYINGAPVLLDWKTNTYCFVATEEFYDITGSFEPSLNATPRDATRWDTANQAHGIMNAYYPSSDDAWLMDIQGEYQAISAVAKNYMAGADGTGGEGFALNLGLKLNSGKEYIFRIIRQNNKYYCQRFQINGSDWTKKELDSAAVAAICGEGAEFKVERTAADTLSVSVNGVVYDTYTMAGITDNNWVSNAIMGHYGNRGEKVSIAYKLTAAPTSGTAQFNSGELGKYVIVYDHNNSDYVQLANQLKNRITEKYGVTLKVVSDAVSSKSDYEILLGDTNRYNTLGRVMEYSVTVSRGVFKINVGGSFSAEKAVSYLCDYVFNGQALTLRSGEHYHTSFLTNSRAITSGTTARVMTANVLADAFADEATYKEARYRAEIFAGMLVSYTPDVVGMQEVDANWNNILDSYLTKIAKTHGIQYSRCLATYGGKVNYSSFIYRSDKFKVENSGLEAFSWWKDLGANYRYHMRNISWAQFASLENSNTKFVVANTHWSYRTEHADGKTYLTGAQKPIATDELRQQCKTETSQFMSKLKTTYSGMPVFLTGDFNTSLSYFTQYNWTPTSFKVISEQAKSAGKALSTVPTSGHYDHLFGTGSYTILCYEFFKNGNQHSVLTDHPFAYADLSF